MNIDPEFKYQIQFMLERFMEEQLGVVDTASEKNKIVGIPFVTQNIVELFCK